MRIDVVDVGWFEARAFEHARQCELDARSGRVDRDEIVRVGRLSVTEHLGIDARAALLGEFHLLEDKYRAAFG